MITVESFISAWRKESKICINLFSKMPAGGLDYRPTPGQRDTVELLRYLSFGPYNGVVKIVAGDWNKGRSTADVTAGMPASDFPGRMAWQAEAAAREIRSVPMSTLLHGDMVLPWGETMKRGEALFAYPLRWLTGYRMQLFLYLKAAGASQLNTGDCWRLPDPAKAG
ncbi:MAG TPA: hypothetical protein VJ385_10840 [Fibrobacteria bacterium]|nr:hypothetical protein [Fibrobacteria bacterium]